MGWPIPRWPVSLCAVILTSPLKRLRQGEARQTTVWLELFSGDWKEEGKSMSCLLSGNGPNIQLDLLVTENPHSERIHQIKGACYRHLWEGSFQVRKYNLLRPQGESFPDSSSWTSVALSFKSLGRGGVCIRQQDCICFVPIGGLPCVHNR